MSRWQDKVVLITGGGAGIGRHYASSRHWSRVR